VRLLLLFLSFLLAVPPLAASDASLSLVKEPAIVALFAEVMELGGSGYRDTERAAFIVIEATGEYRCVDWPFRNGHRKQVFRGDMPPFTVAIAHTHPKGSLRPSAADRATAKSAGVPVFVLTPRAIWVATHDGQVAVVVANRPWARGETATGRCAAPEGVNTPRR
jgi:proteasome lid subunit RPN8/RPN11